MNRPNNAMDYKPTIVDLLAGLIAVMVAGLAGAGLGSVGWAAIALLYRTLQNWAGA